MYCECGCGQKTNLSAKNDHRWKAVKGKPRRFIHGHSARKNGRTMQRGAVLLYIPKHSKSNNTGYVYEHVLVAEKVLGKSLPALAIVHHIDGNRANNHPSNLLICQNRSYHNLIHQRQIAYKACGNPNYRKCKFCKKYDDPINLTRNGGGAYHKKCRRGI